MDLQKRVWLCSLGFYDYSDYGYDFLGQNLGIYLQKALYHFVRIYQSTIINTDILEDTILRADR